VGGVGIAQTSGYRKDECESTSASTREMLVDEDTEANQIVRAETHWDRHHAGRRAWNVVGLRAQERQKRI
jgi:hypothetical protein